MSILVFALVVIIVAALVIWALQKIPLPYPIGLIIQAVVLLFAAYLIAQRAGII